ncbi:hypothetical protein chiPu_0025910, partial [Chiloscyllium punctatum]|nr:hypothetical protein [Chiloscyllium punctatum]
MQSVMFVQTLILFQMTLLQSLSLPLSLSFSPCISLSLSLHPIKRHAQRETGLDSIGRVRLSSKSHPSRYTDRNRYVLLPVRELGECFPGSSASHCVSP